MNKRCITACAAAFSAMAILSCQKEFPNLNNPLPVRLEAAAFSVSVCDRQPGIDPDSSYFFYGQFSGDVPDGVIEFSEGTSEGSAYRFRYKPDPVKLIQTESNLISFETTEDVNAASSTESVDIIKTNPRHFELKYVSDGSTVIKLWNGEGESEKAVKIRVESRKSVRCEGFEFRIDGRQFILKEFNPGRTFGTSSWDKLLSDPGYRYQERLPYAFVPEPDRQNPRYKEYQRACETGGYDLIEFCYDPGKGVCLEFVGTIPRNATPDNKIYARCDPVNMKFQNATWFDNGRAPFYIWNRRNYEGFRWMPQDETASDMVYRGKSGTRYYPADLRYRKAWIWNRELDDSSIRSKSCQYLVYYICDTDKGEERNFAGCLEEN